MRINENDFDRTIRYILIVILVILEQKKTLFNAIYTYCII